MEGRIVHSWKFKLPLFYAKIRSNGNIVAAFFTTDLKKHPSKGGTGTVAEYSWEGAKLWSYSHPMMHHDFELLPNGNIAILVWEALSDEVKKVLKNKKNYSSWPKKLWGDAILEINSKGKIVWRWSSHHLLLQDRFQFGSLPIDNKGDWSHGNGLNFIEADPFKKEKAFLVSYRNLSSVIMLSKSDKNILWTSGDMTDVQHDPSLTRAGNILIFDNQGQKNRSRIIEINPTTNKIVWKYPGDSAGPMEFQFSAAIVSGVQELQNGNILISNGVLGHVFEITRKGRKVWEFFSVRYKKDTGAGWPFKGFFKVRKHPLGYFLKTVQDQLIMKSQDCKTKK